MKRLLASLVLASLIGSSSPVFALAQASPVSTRALAEGFNPNAVLDDADLFELGDWDADDIQRFLTGKKSALATLTLADIDGVAKRPADIIWRVAGSYKLNPKYLLALLQKEQSLVEDSSPTQRQLDWAMGFGVCDSCAMDDPAIQAYKGFANQTEYAAKQHRERYLFQLLTRGTTISGHAPGRVSLIDRVEITPVNQATAMLYTYTPHIHGNYLLWQIWRRWFARSLPDGTVVASKDRPEQRFLLRRGERRPLSPAVFVSLGIAAEKIVLLGETDLTPYPEGEPLRFPNFSLVEVPDGSRYLLSGEQKRHIVSLKAFRALGFQEDEVIEATLEDLKDYSDGPDLKETSRYPTGLLAKDKKGAYWYVEDGVRHPIPHPAFLKLYFRGRPARTLSATEAQGYPIGDPYRLRDGELVRSANNPAVYVIDQGQRRPIPSEAAFLGFGYTWKNVLTLPEAVLEDYPEGEPLEPAWQPTSLASEVAPPTSEAISLSTSSPSL
jgi:hypothetical protein